MPTWLAVALLVVFLVALVTFGVVLFHALWGLIGNWWAVYRLQPPLVRKDRPDPNQWLLDIAKEDAENPAQFLLITDSMIVNSDLHEHLERPWIELGVTLRNCNVHTVTVGDVTGHARFHGNELREPISGSTGKSNKPRGHSHVYTMRQYLSPDQARQIQEERVEETRLCGGQRRKELRSLSLAGVALEGECGGRNVQFALGSVERFRFE